MRVPLRREASLPDKYVPELREACQRAGLDWDKFLVTDNTCPPHPPKKNPIQELGDDIVLVRTCMLTGQIWSLHVGSS